MEELRRLTPILEALNARLILIVQDVERTGATFDTRHLQRLLWALRDLPHVSFVLAIDPSASDLDFTKLCDSIEMVQQLRPWAVEDIIDTAFTHWMTEYSYIDPHRNRERGKLGLSYVRIGGAYDYLDAQQETPPLTTS